MQHAKGFTLIELMVTVVLVAILASIALPAYNDYVTRSKFVEATAILADLRVKMEQYYADNRRYNVDGDLTTCGIPGGKTPVVTDGRYFAYACVPGDDAGPLGAQSYVLTAAGTAAQGLDGIAFTVNERNVKTTAVTPTTEMANRGYTGAGCWVRKKPGEC